MPFVTRAVIALLSGVGAGLIGFWIVWSFVQRVLNADPGVGSDAFILAGIFLPGAIVPLAVFRSISRATAVRPV